VAAPDADLNRHPMVSPPHRTIAYFDSLPVSCRGTRATEIPEARRWSVQEQDAKRAAV
jgi:hypothetical protein